MLFGIWKPRRLIFLFIHILLLSFLYFYESYTFYKGSSQTEALRDFMVIVESYFRNATFKSVFQYKHDLKVGNFLLGNAIATQNLTLPLWCGLGCLSSANLDDGGGVYMRRIRFV